MIRHSVLDRRRLYSEQFGHITILDVEVLAEPQKTASGFEVLAYFDAEFLGLQLRKLSLVRRPDHKLTVWAAFKGDYGLVSHALRMKLMVVARAAYKDAGGQHAEWIPTEEGAEA